MSKKTKIIISVFAAIIVAALAVIIPFVFLKKQETKKLETPNKPIISQNENLISIKTSKVENAVKYIYEITIPTENEKVLVFKDTSNVLLFDFLNDSSSWKDDFNVGGIYSVCVYAVAGNEENNSEKSPVANFERFIKLDTTTLFKTSKQLTWDYVKEADYYEIYVSSNEVNEVYTMPATTETKVMINTLKTELNLPLGYYTFCVKACSNNQYLTNSDFSNVLEFYINE
ncbi:MAG: hypothetical protein J5779_00245 [Clostridia bacterium]|nr:hypothetical protein [Clostridia bacterium]